MLGSPPRATSMADNLTGKQENWLMAVNTTPLEYRYSGLSNKNSNVCSLWRWDNNKIVTMNRKMVTICIFIDNRSVEAEEDNYTRTLW